MPVRTQAGARAYTAVPRWWVGVGVGEGVLLSILAILVYYEIFSVFRMYDDEGYMMLTVKHFLAGHPLYDQVWTLYGPVYFFYKWVVHGLLALPLTHDVVRLTAMSTWLSTGMVAAIAVLGLTGSVALAALGQLLVTWHLLAIANEPGHPQELGGFLTMAIVAVMAVVRGRSPRLTPVALGLMVAALTMVKVNLGIFIGLAAWMAVLSTIPLTGVSGALRALSTAALIAFPALLMRLMLDDPRVWNFAAMESLSAIAVSTIALTNRGGPSRLSDLAALATGWVAGVALIGVTTFANGTTLAALVDCLITTPSRMSALFVSLPAVFFPPPLTAAAAVLLAVAVRTTQRWRAQRHFLGLAKLVFGMAALNGAWHHDITGAALLGAVLLFLLTPFSWLALTPVEGSEDASPGLARLVLCWAAVLQPLQLYPVAGSQLFFGTVLQMLIGAVCLGDAARWLRSLSPVLGHRALQAATTVVVLLIVADLGVEGLRAAQQRYDGLTPLELPGTTRLRLPPGQVDILHSLTRTLRERSDTFLCVPGFSSLYFWTGKDPPTLDVLGHEMRFYPEDRQLAMLRALVHHRAPMVVRFRGLAAPYPPFEARLNRGFKPLMDIGPYHLLVLRR